MSVYRTALIATAILAGCYLVGVVFVASHQFASLRDALIWPAGAAALFFLDPLAALIYIAMLSTPIVLLFQEKTRRLGLVVLAIVCAILDLIAMVMHGIHD